MKRVFDIEVQRRACSGKLKRIAVIEAPDVIEKMVKPLGLDAQPPPRERARRVDVFEGNGVYEAA
jgi:hypothetical protein